MPVMDGLTILVEIRREHPDLPVIMLSTLTTRGGEATIDALSLGATDYVTKPSAVDLRASMEQLNESLLSKMLCLGKRSRRVTSVGDL